MCRDAVENPNGSSIQFVLDTSERERWNAQVEPKVRVRRGPIRYGTPAGATRDVIHVAEDSELIPQLQDVGREHRLQRT